jgi:predicted esterase
LTKKQKSHPLRRPRRALAWLALTCWLGCPSRARAEERPAPAWCAPELDALTDTVCFHAPAPADTASAAEERRTLVIFLHGLVRADSDWAWGQQRLMARMAKAHGFTALMPRGRPGFGPGRDPEVLAWPTAQELQELHEDSLLAELAAARAELERRAGSFERVLVFGFSNGAYYGASLALRGKLAVDGYGIFAGGSGGKYSRLLASRAVRRVPIFVGYGTKDRARRDPRGLADLLRELGWPHRVKVERIGHTVSDAQIRAALSFLKSSAPLSARADDPR